MSDTHNCLLCSPKRGPRPRKMRVVNVPKKKRLLRTIYTYCQPPKSLRISRAVTDVHYSTASPRNPSWKGILLRDKSSIEYFDRDSSTPLFVPASEKQAEKVGHQGRVRPPKL